VPTRTLIKPNPKLDRLGYRKKNYGICMKKRRTVKKKKRKRGEVGKKQEPGSDKVRKGAGQGVGVENGICCFRWDGLN
jgi:hypothetical protein